MPRGSAWTLGSSSTINWPSTARAGSGNGGVAQIVKSTPGAIGYVDYSDAKASGLTFASVKNKAGDYVAPSVGGGLRGRGQVTVKPEPDVQRGLGARRQRVPDHLLSRGFWSTRSSRTRTTRPCSRRTSATCSEPARNCSPALGYAPLPASIDQKATGAAQQDRHRNRSEHCDAGRSDRRGRREHCDAGGSGRPGRIRPSPCRSGGRSATAASRSSRSRPACWCW